MITSDKQYDAARAKIEIQKLLTIFRVAEVNSIVLELSINSKFGDFEDADECCEMNCHLY